MRQVQTFTESDGMATVVVYEAPDDWEPGADWPVLGSVSFPTNDPAMITGLMIGTIDALGGVIEVDGEVLGADGGGD